MDKNKQQDMHGAIMKANDNIRWEIEQKIELIKIYLSEAGYSDEDINEYLDNTTFHY
jgi:hypothetical protein